MLSNNYAWFIFCLSSIIASCLVFCVFSENDIFIIVTVKNDDIDSLKTSKVFDEIMINQTCIF